MCSWWFPGPAPIAPPRGRVSRVARRRHRAAPLLFAASVSAVAVIAAHAAAQSPAATPGPPVPPGPSASTTAPPSAPRSIGLRWAAPPGCPDEAAVTTRIDRLLGGPPRAADRRLEAAATIEPAPNGFRLELTLSTDTSESTRILQGESCDTVADAAALVIALAFDPDAVAAQELKRTDEDAGAPDAEPVPTSSPTAAPSAAPAPTEIVRIPVPVPQPTAPAPVLTPGGTSFSIAAFASLLGDAGSLADVAPGLRAGVALGIGPFRIAPAFEAWPSARRTLADRPDLGVELRLLVFALDGCWRLLPSSRLDPAAVGFEAFAALVCIGVEAGEMRGTGFGVATPGSAGVLWGAARGSLRGELPIVRGLSATLDVGVAVPLDRRPFVLTLAGAREVVHEPSVVAGRAGLGASFRF